MAELMVALDFDTQHEMESMVTQLGHHVSHYKVGHQLFTALGPDSVKWLTGQGKKVFLDLKLHEIPNSVAKAVHNGGKLGVNWITVHASGGTAMMAAACEAASLFPQLKILALTVVTGLSDADLNTIGFQENSQQLTLRLARLAQQSGCSGIVCSAQDLSQLKLALPIGVEYFCPGIRPAGSASQDQARVANPTVAAQANVLIVGRPITQATNPLNAALAIIQDIEQANEDESLV